MDMREVFWNWTKFNFATRAIFGVFESQIFFSLDFYLLITYFVYVKHTLQYAKFMNYTFIIVSILFSSPPLTSRY